MLQTVKNAWKLPELRNKLLFTIFILLVFRFGSVLSVPFVDSSVLKTAFEQQTAGTILDYFNMLSGEAFSRATLFALSISPYITAQIVMQLLTIAIPALERLAKEGDEGRKRSVRLPVMQPWVWHLSPRTVITPILKTQPVWLSASVM